MPGPGTFASVLRGASTIAVRILPLRRKTVRPILPTDPDGSPPPSFVHVSPPFVDLNNPPLGPPLSNTYGLRMRSHRLAYRMFGFAGSMTKSPDPVRSSCGSPPASFFQVLPPSTVLKTPRSWL